MICLNHDFRRMLIYSLLIVTLNPTLNRDVLLTKALILQTSVGTKLLLQPSENKALPKNELTSSNENIEKVTIDPVRSSIQH